jgi:phosphoribosyl 1,2-cyclic phosphodiesterase
VIFDAGSGLRPLGNSLARSAGGIEADIFLSHCHSDHIGGLPFFAPSYLSTSRIRVWAGNLLPERTLAPVARELMSAPLFPATAKIFNAHLEFRDFHCGEALRPQPDIVLQTAPLNHPGGATGYRLEHGGHAIAYVTDTEHRPGQFDPHVLNLAAGADLLIYDCNYTDEEFVSHVGWGHSTWQEGIRIAEAAGAKRLAIFHHDPDHDDAFLDDIKARASARHAGAIVAAEGLVLTV